MIKPFATPMIERIFFLAALSSGLITAGIFLFMLALGLPLIEGGLFFQALTLPWAPHHHSYGILPMIAGTLAVSTLALLFSFPLSLGCASFISFLGPRKTAASVRRIVLMLTGVPTVVYGFVGVFLLVPYIRELFQEGSGLCILSASIILSLLVSPTMVLFFTASFENVPASYLVAADALGATRVQKLIYVVLPNAWKGVSSGVVLALGRALGDTLISLMIAGNAVHLPGSLLSSTRTLTAHIALVNAADYESLEFKSIFVCGIVLYLFTMAAALAVRWLGAPLGEKTP